ncbi:MAG: hypothetical protein SWK76_12435 [Actinomycetota bacterium]|nr:hypothetical protein [Actinomycetota bacterium]
MKPKKRIISRVMRLLPVFILAVVVALAATSCGSGGSEESQASSSIKLPPGMTEESLEEDAGTSVQVTAVDDEEEAEEEEGEDQEEDEGEEDETSSQDTSSAGIDAYFDGIFITVLSATREDSNEIVAAANQRETAGDYLQIELFMENVGDELVDLSKYSFRIYNTAIDADVYEDFYGTDGTYGGYVSENVISATLLDYASLQSVTYKLKLGESVSDVFLFYDLNPCSTYTNSGFVLENTNLVIYNTDSGEEVEINLAGLAS